nr:MAG TPA: hypothetical protein [Caudoviricetes sp.]
MADASGGGWFGPSAGCLRRRFSCFCKKIDKKQPQGGADRCLLPPQSRPP